MVNAQKMFATIDRLDAYGFAEFFAEDATAVAGNGDPVLGRPAILAANIAYMAMLKGIRHVIRSKWTVDDTTIAVTDVTYTRQDDKQVTIPVVSIWRVGEDDLITDFRLYYDLTPVFA
ncbi:nuclear transport factor 2 family protein [Kutzneria chonburiensis]|uniref:Nuclear transport factor 2 family protein n=1 Tax=Kutzneria chonburiensis TaxID=1483604 RepID=A0ABV6MQY6_9PSEU|nr:nuclear transport factor 2 family protein [Kutzneria chonburiensis]